MAGLPDKPIDQLENVTTTTILEKSEMPNSLRFAHVCSKIKHLDRTGWLRFNVSKPETVGGHMYRMATMSAFLFDDGLDGLDMNKCIRMSLAHDIGESIIGDITPVDGVPKEVKLKLEAGAIDQIAQLVSKNKGDEIRSLFMEFEEKKTPEARFVNGLDKFDMIVQAYEYEQEENKPKFLQEFFDSTEDFFKDVHPVIKDLVAKLYAAREANVPFPKVA